MNDKFFKNLIKKIEKCQKYYDQIKLEKNKTKVEEIKKELEMEYEEISGLIVGKMNIIWAKIEKMPDGDKKDYEIFKYNSLVEDIENICQI